MHIGGSANGQSGLPVKQSSKTINLILAESRNSLAEVSGIFACFIDSKIFLNLLKDSFSTLPANVMQHGWMIMNSELEESVRQSYGLISVLTSY